jgi:O-methyltransferase
MAGNNVLNVVNMPRAQTGSAEAALPVELTPADHQVLARVRTFTMTSPARLAALIKATRYVVTAGIPGDLVECGVWRGGSMMAVALTLLNMGVRDRMLYLYDTYEGMPPPGDSDVDMYGVPAAGQMDREIVKAASPWDAVKEAIESTGYPREQIRMVQGKVEDTIPGNVPEKIALLRLDTDWYESTRHELEHLFPRLQLHGPLIIDDYGHWQGARRAVDEYFARRPILLNFIDYTGRIGVKIA